MRLVNVWWARPRVALAVPSVAGTSEQVGNPSGGSESPSDPSGKSSFRGLSQQKLSTALDLGLRYLFLTRYSWILGITLIAPAPVALVVLPGMLANFFVLDSPQQIYHVSWITLWCAAAVLETMRVTTLNAQFRFDDYRTSVRRFRKSWDHSRADRSSADHSRADSGNEWYRRIDGWILLGFALIAVLATWYVIVDACIARTASDPAPTWAPYVGSPVTPEAVIRRGWDEAWQGLFTTVVILGVVNGLVIIGGEWSRHRGSRTSILFDGFSAAASSRSVQHKVPTSDRWQTLVKLLHRLVGPGYFIPYEDEDGQPQDRLRLAPGHVGLMFYTVAFLVGYALNYRSTTGADLMPTEASPTSALFYALMALLLITYLLPGIAFFLDRYRWPVVLVLGVGTLVLYGSFGTDHFYELNPLPARPAAALPTLTQVYDRWQLPVAPDGRRTLVVVHASGGGIQASAWTAQVLTGLHERYGDAFSRSLGLISSVSGGSVGTMYYLLNRRDLREPFAKTDSPVEVLDSQSIATIRELSRSSALEATAWGLAYPDTMRLLFPPAISAERDRGWAIERVWRQRLNDGIAGEMDLGDLRITDLSTQCLNNQFPVVAFNATVVETGQRVVISPVRSPENPTGEEEAAVELMRQFPNAQPRVSTAARLSATFPYVTPAARASYQAEQGTDAERIANYHIVDGGYSDNEGAMTSVDWINRILAHYSRDETILERPFDRVLLIRIQAFPKKRAASPYKPNQLAGWTSALLGPLTAMLNVRGTSQMERGDLEVGLLTQATRASIMASKERFESEFRTSQAWADSVEQEVDSLESYLRDLVKEGKLNDADLARWSSTSRDRLSAARGMVEQNARKRERLAQLSVAAVSFEFQPPQNDWIPFSWKLTESQKRNIDEAWRRLIEKADGDDAFSLLDESFTPRRTTAAGPAPPAAK